MDDLFFEEKQIEQRYEDFEIKGIIGWLIKRKIVKDKKQANVVLVIMVVLFLFLTMFLLLDTYSEKGLQTNIDKITGQKIIPGQIPGGI